MKNHNSLDSPEDLFQFMEELSRNNICIVCFVDYVILFHKILFREKLK